MKILLFFCGLFLILLSEAVTLHAASSNIPLDSHIYDYVSYLHGAALIKSDMTGIRPWSRRYAARLFLEAQSAYSSSSAVNPLAEKMIEEGIRYLGSDFKKLKGLYSNPSPFDFDTSFRLRSVYLDGSPRSYERKVNDPGGDGVFGIGGGLRPSNPYPSPTQHHGTEGTPLLENNNGTIHPNGWSGDIRISADVNYADFVTALFEPELVAVASDSTFRLNRGYLKFGGGSFELEGGRDENWFGFGKRGAITLSSNAQNFTMLKLSSPEPFETDWLFLLGNLRYSMVFSQFDETGEASDRRQPWFYGLKLSCMPIKSLEIGFNLGRQVGGPGVDNSFGNSLRGLIGGTSADNSNGMAGFEARYTLESLRNTEIFGEFSGEDTAAFWPIVESYLAGIFIPRITDDGSIDLRFEYFRGNQILYSHSTFPNGYIFNGMPIGHSQGGATQDISLTAAKWLDPRSRFSLQYFYNTRGHNGLLPGQSMESKHAGRVRVDFPLIEENVDASLVYGAEWIDNLNLQGGVNRSNQLALFELRYKY